MSLRARRIRPLAHVDLGVRLLCHWTSSCLIDSYRDALHRDGHLIASCEYSENVLRI
jgi:hypothetical protein